MPRQICIILLILLSLACGGQRKNTAPVQAANPQKLNIHPAGEGDKILFLTLEVTRADSTKDEYGFSVKKVQFANGIVKGANLKEEPVIEKNNLYCQLSSREGETGDWLKLPDPLSTVYEYPGEASGELGKIVLQKRKSELTLRLQWNPKSPYLSIYKPASNSFTLKKIYYAQF